MARGVYKRGNIWWIMYADSTGTMRFESSGSRKQKDAVALLHKRKANIKEDTEVNSSFSI